MSIHDTQSLDDTVLATVKSGARTFSAVWVSLSRADVKVEPRDVDRSLQRLRRKKLLQYSGVPRWWTATV